MEEGDDGADDELGAGEVGGEVAEVFDCEGWGEVGVVEGEADFLVGFAAGDLVFSQWSVVVQGGETMGEWLQGVSWMVSAFPPGNAA